METYNASNARSNLYRLIDRINETSVPVLITGKKSNAVLISEDDWRAIQETIYLTSIPGMTEKIRHSMTAPREEFTPLDEVDWD